MATDIPLIEKREALKYRLAKGEYKTLVDVFLERFEHLIQKLTRQSKSLPLWANTIALSIVFISMDFAALYISGNVNEARAWLEQSGEGYGLGYLLLWWFSIIVLLVVSMIVVNHYIAGIFKLWQDDILDATESEASLDEFQDWLDRTCNRRLHLLMTIMGGLLVAIFLSVTASIQTGGFVGYGWTFAIFSGSVLLWAFTHLFLMVILLSAKLSRYDLKLFAANPRSSEILSRLSGKFNLFIYYIGIYTAILTLTTASIGFLSYSVVFFGLLYGLSLVILFALNQISLSSIIRRAKWKTLNEIQVKVEKIQAMENFEQKETMDTINRLMDFYDRVRVTRDSGLDWRASLSFINSLLLPLFAFLLGNLDLVLKLLGIKR
jgi:hypothetical protein